MSYLSAESLPFSSDTVQQGVISLWFKVPQASLDAATQAYIPPSANPDTPSTPLQLNGIIPLVTFGEIFNDAYTITNVQVTVPGGTENLVDVSGELGLCTQTVVDSFQTADGQVLQPQMGQTYSLNPCFIGVDCSPGPDPGNPTPPALCVILQTGDYATASGLVWVEQGSVVGEINSLGGNPINSETGHLCGQCVAMPLSAPPHLLIFVLRTVTDIFNAAEDGTDLLIQSARESFGGTSPTITVTSDQWHHVLLSFDLTGTVVASGSLNDSPQSISSTCSMWLAFDDENYTNNAAAPSDLPCVQPPADAVVGDNGIITANALKAYGASFGTPFIGPGVVPNWQSYTTASGFDTPPVYSYSPLGLPCSNAPMGLPASTEMVDNIYHVEMAEFLMFTGVTLDTSDQTQRRYFVDDNGKPVPPNQKANPQTNTTSGAIEGLGQQPDVMLHGSGNWIEGHNTGSTGFNVDGSINPDGQFTPTAKITAYKPDPSLHGPQDPPTGRRGGPVQLSRKPTKPVR